MLILICSFVLSRKRRKSFHEIGKVRCSNAIRTDRCWQGSVHHNNGLWQLKIDRRLQFWRGNRFAVKSSRSDKLPSLPRALYRFVIKLPWFTLFSRFRWRYWCYVAQVRASSFSRHFLKPCLSWNQREEIFIFICTWLSRCWSFGIASVL